MPKAGECRVCDGEPDRKAAVDRLLAAGDYPALIERKLRGLWTGITNRVIVTHRGHWLHTLQTTDADALRRLTASHRAKTDLSELVRDDVRRRIEDGELQPSVQHGLQAQAQLDRREERAQDRELALGIAAMLAGGGTKPPARIISGDVERLPPSAGELTRLRGRVATPIPANVGDTTASPVGAE